MRVLEIRTSVSVYRPHPDGYLLKGTNGVFIVNKHHKGKHETPWDSVVSILKPSRYTKHIYAKPMNKEDWL